MEYFAKFAFGFNFAVCEGIDTEEEEEEEEEDVGNVDDAVEEVAEIFSTPSTFFLSFPSNRWPPANGINFGVSLLAFSWSFTKPPFPLNTLVGTKEVLEDDEVGFDSSSFRRFSITLKIILKK